MQLHETFTPAVVLLKAVENLFNFFLLIITSKTRITFFHFFYYDLNLRIITCLQNVFFTRITSYKLNLHYFVFNIYCTLAKINYAETRKHSSVSFLTLEDSERNINSSVVGDDLHVQRRVFISMVIVLGQTLGRLNRIQFDFHSSSGRKFENY